MTNEFDIVVVGARCAGSPLAIQLAQAGLSVAVVDKDEFPSDTPSTHFFQTDGLVSLARLGVLDRLKATGAPVIEAARVRIEDVVLYLPWPTLPGDVGGAMCVRRPLLDTILVKRAQEAGADVRTGTRVVGLVGDNGRIVGVRVKGRNGAGLELQARLVVGADGRASVVAREAGTRMYNVTKNERFAYWGYYETGSTPFPATSYFQRFGEELLLGAPTDSGLFLVIVLPPLDRLSAFRADIECSFDDHLAKDEVLSGVVSGCRRSGRLQAMQNFTGYFRESAGPGWVLVGDAGHFKDPTPAQGISDALRQADKLAPAIIEGLRGDQTALDAAMRGWWRWRDQDAFEMYWLAQDFGRGGAVPAVAVEITRRLVQQGRSKDFMNILSHRTRPSELLPPGRLFGAAGGLLGRGGDATRGQILHEVRELMGREIQHRCLNRRPEYQPAGTPV
jgi:2-polyprenyl-6-methoxyphenol hydroxylase-like FAD-dependent oxidoreductase